MDTFRLLAWCETASAEEQIAELEHVWALQEDVELAELERAWSLPDTRHLTSS